MDDKILNEALENVSVIKGVIDRTSRSFVAFSKIFICWGLLFILNGIINLVVYSNWDSLQNIIRNYSFLISIVHPGIITAIAALIYVYISKKIPLAGLEKHLMKIWVLIIAMNAIQPKISIQSMLPSVDFSDIIVRTDNFSVVLFGLAIALIATVLFTDYKQLRNLGIIYICISVIHLFLRIQLLDGPAITQIIYFLPLPFTFLYTGFFLRSRQIRGN